MTKPQLWVSGWLAIIEGLCAILTIGWWRPNVEMRWCVWCTLRELAVKRARERRP